MQSYETWIWDCFKVYTLEVLEFCNIWEFNTNLLVEVLTFQVTYFCMFWNCFINKQKLNFV